jgi:hypothetical protein
VTVASTRGWKTTFRLGHATRFRGERAVIAASLDLTSLLALLHRVEATTAVGGSYTLTLAPHVATTGQLEHLALRATFAPQIHFALSKLEVQPLAPGGGSGAGADPPASLFTPAARGSVAGERVQPALLSLKVARLGVLTARWIALGGIAAVTCALLVTLALLRPRRREESARIIARYGRLIVPVERVWQLPGVAVIDVADIDSLVRIAEHYDRSILHERGDGAGAFWVTDESGQFRYAVGADPAGDTNVVAQQLADAGQTDELDALRDSGEHVPQPGLPAFAPPRLA